MMPEKTDNKQIDNNTTRKRVLWEKQITTEALKEQLDDAIFSGNSLKLQNIIRKNPSFKIGLKAYLTQTINDAPVAPIQAFFDKCDENIAIDASNNANLSDLLLVLFKEIDFEQTKIAFEKMRKCLEAKEIEYSSEFVRIFNESVEIYNQELATNTQIKTIFKRNNYGFFSYKQNEEVEPRNPTKKVKIEDHTLTTGQQNDELTLKNNV